MQIACKNIDRLVNVGFHMPGMPRQDIGELYALCAKDAPVSYKCVKDILSHPGAPAGEYAFLTPPMSETALLERLGDMSLLSRYRVLD